MQSPTPTTNVSELPDQTSRRVLWLELRPAEEPPGEPWYDPAALHEEPERWDGMA